MKCLPLFCAALALTFTFAPGCKKQDGANAATKGKGGPNEVVASVDGVKFLRKDLDVLVDTRMGFGDIPENQLEDVRNQLESRYVDEFIKKTLLLNEAKKEGIVVTEEDRKEMIDRITPRLAEQNMTLEDYFQRSPFGEEFARAEFEKGLVFEKLLKEKVISKITIEDDVLAKTVEEATQAITQANAEAEEANKAMESNEVKRAKLEGFKKQLEAGADFAELAKEHSACPSGQRSGGALGTFARGQMVKPFEDAAFTQEVGKVGDIIETQFGYHLILVTAKTPAVAATDDTPEAPEAVAASHILLTFDQEQPLRPIPSVEEIRTYLRDQRAQPAAMEYLKVLQAKAKVESIIPIDEPEPRGM